MAGGFKKYNNKSSGDQPGGQDFIFRLRDEYAIPRAVTDWYLKLSPYISMALRSAFVGDQETENEHRMKFSYYFSNIVISTIMLAGVKPLFEKKFPELSIRNFILKINAYAKSETKSSEMLDMFLAYTEILTEAGLLEAYDRKESLQNQWEGGF